MMSETPKAVIDHLTTRTTSASQPFNETAQEEAAVAAIWELQDNYKMQAVWAGPLADEEWLRLLDSDIEKICDALKRWARWVHEQAQSRE